MRRARGARAGAVVLLRPPVWGVLRLACARAPTSGSDEAPPWLAPPQPLDCLDTLCDTVWNVRELDATRQSAPRVADQLLAHLQRWIPGWVLLQTRHE